VMEKVVWAAENLNALKVELRRYLDNKPAEVVAETEPDTNRLIHRIRPRIPIPVSIPLRIGDCVQNLRSSLDYLVWELVLAANKVPTDKHQFPICSSADAFESELRRHRLDGISPEALAEIKRLQPYKASQGKVSPIVIVNDLANVNKHRRMLLTLLSVLAAETEFTSALGKQVQSFFPLGDSKTHIGIGPPMHIAKKVHMQSNVAYAVIFDEGIVKGHEVSQCLGVLIDIIGNGAIAKFEKFFQ